MGFRLPKNGHKERDANNSLKWSHMPKEGKVINGGVVGNVYCKMQKFVFRKSKEFINKKICTISTFFKLLNFCIRCIIFLVNKVLKVVPYVSIISFSRE